MSHKQALILLVLVIAFLPVLVFIARAWWGCLVHAWRYFSKPPKD